MGTKNIPGDFDCYANAAPDEPMFILLGRDRHAAILVRLWAILRAHADEDEAKVDEAMQCAAAMDTWADTLGKLPVWQNNNQSRLIAALYVRATKGLAEHPEGFGEPCDCDLCRSYSC